MASISSSIISDWVYIYNGQRAYSNTINSGGYLWVFSGGTANETMVNSSGWLIVDNGGSANSTTVNSSGHLWVSSGGTANNTTINFSGYLGVDSGGLTNSTRVNEGGLLWVSSGGTANNTTVNFSGQLCVDSVGSANSTTVNSGGLLWISSGGIARKITENGGYVYVASGADVTFSPNSFSGLVLSSGRSATVHSGTTANSTTVNSDGRMFVYSGGTVSDTTVKSGGYVGISSGGTHTGSMNITSTGRIYFYEGGIANLNLSGRTSASDVLISNMTLVQGTPSFTITVSDSQTSGIYKLAAEVGSFDKTITVQSEISGVLGTLSIGHNLTVGDKVYSLLLDNRILSLQIGTEADVPADDTLLPYVLPHAEYMYGCIATSVGMLLGYYDLYGYTIDGTRYDFSNLIEGTISVDSRGSDGGSIYDMSDPSALANFIASTNYVSRFYGQTPAAERPYTFVNGDPDLGLNVSEWNCLADYLGTGQYWRGNSDLSTQFYYDSLEGIKNAVYTWSGNGITIPAQYVDFKYGLDLYAGTRGYQLEESRTRSVEKEDFSFEELMAEIDAGRPVLLSMHSENGGGHMVIAYGYNSSTREVIFDDTYRSNCRMEWDGTYEYSEDIYSLNAVTTIQFQASQPLMEGQVKVYSGSSIISAADYMENKVLSGNTEDSMEVYSGGTAVRTAVHSGGFLNVSSGGTAESTTVSSGGVLNVSSGALIRGLMIENGATVSADTGAEINFDLIDRTSSDDVLVTRQNLIQGSPSYTITVSATQETGIYRLASGVDSFASSITITSTTETTKTLSLGNMVLLDGQTYSQALSSNMLTLSVSLADTTPPDAPTASANTTAPTNQNVAVTAVFSNDSVLKQYSLNGTVWSSYPGPIVRSDNGTLYFRGIDEAGNISEITSYTVTNIDKIAPNKPTASANITSVTNQNVTVSATFSSDSAQKQYSLNNSTWNAYTAGIVMQSNGAVYFRGIDAAGNISDVTCYTVTNIDKIAPNKPTASANITSLTNKDVTVTAVFSSDSAVKEYSLNGAQWQIYTSGVVMTENKTVYFRGTDVAGNISDVTSYTVSNIDKIAPVKPTAAADVSEMTNGNVTVTAEFSEDSIVQEYSRNNSTWQTYTSGIVFEQNGTVYFRGTDAAGNVSEVTSFTVSNIDKVAPDAPVVSADITSLTNQNVTLTAIYPNDTAIKQYSLDGTTWNTYVSGVEISENGTVYFRGKDAAGNVSEVTSYSVTNIDKVAPVKPTASADVTTPTNQNVTVSAVFSDDSAGKQYSLNGTTWNAYTDPVVMTGNGTVYFRGTDDLGNISEITSVTVSNIDKIAPVMPTAAADITELTTGNVTVTAVFSEDSVSREYSWNNSTWQTYTSGIVFNQNGTVYFRGTDAAGNISDVTSYTVSNIKQKQPDAPKNLIVSVNKYNAVLSWNKVTPEKGVKVSYKVRLDGDDGKTFTTNSNKYTFKNADIGNHTFEVCAVFSNIVLDIDNLIYFPLLRIELPVYGKAA